VSRAVKIGVSGVAKVYCIHNQEKRSIRGLEFARSQTKVHMCACCENLFLERTDTPMFCANCRRPATYQAGGPPPDPIGVIDG
jgi:hypothetical protein